MAEQKDLNLLFEEVARILEEGSRGRDFREKIADAAIREVRRKDQILLEETEFWLSLSPPFRQDEYLDLLVHFAERRLQEEGISLPVRKHHARQAVKLFLNRHGLEREKEGYLVPPSLALSLIFKRSPEELSRRLAILRESFSLFRVEGILAVLEFLVDGAWPAGGDSPAGIRRLEELVLYALGEEKYRRRLPPVGAGRGLKEVLRRWLREGFSFPATRVLSGALAHLREKSEDPELSLQAAYLALLLGRVEEARNLILKAEPSWESVFLRGLCHYYEGEIEGALTDLDLSLRIYHLERGNRYPTELGEWGIFLARILSLKGPELRSRAVTYLRKLFKENPHLSFLSGPREYLQYLRHGRVRLYRFQRFPLDLLVCAWVVEEMARGGRKISSLERDSLRKVWRKLVEEGFLFPAAEMARAIAACEDEEARSWLRKQGLLRKKKKLPRWKKLLENLREALTGEVEENRRLVWLLDTKNLILTPIEQKRKRDGTWSAGRAVALKRLFEKTYSPLTPEDERVLAHLQEEYVGYGYRRRKFYNFEPEVFLALAGHPRVFDAETRELLEVVEARPEVILRREKEGLRLAVRPAIPDGAEARVHVEKKGSRVMVYRVNPKFARLSFLLGEEGWLFPPEAEGEIRELLGLLARDFQLASDLTPGEAREVPAEKRLFLILRPAENGLRFTVRAQPLGEEGPGFRPGRGPERVTARVGEELLACRRDLSREEELLRRLEDRLGDIEGLEHPEEAEWRAPDLKSALALTEKLEELSQEDYLLLWPEGRPFSVIPSPEDLPLHGRTMEDWLEVETPIKLPEGEVPLAEVLQRLREKPTRFVPLTGDRFLALRENLYRRLREVAELAEIKGRRVRLHPLRAFLLAREAGVPLEGDEAWEEFRTRLERALSLRPEPPAGLRAVLRPYQEEGFVWLRRLYEAGLGGCLADDMGLGKTLQTLALLLAVADRGPSLVVAPASVLSVWQEEARRFTPELTVVPLGEVEDRAAMLREAGPGRVVLVSYGLLQREETAELLSGVDWNVVVLDEAQHIKNYRTKRARHAMKLSARFRLATTGTPIENRLEELWTIFRFLQPGLLGSLEDFRRRFVAPIERGGDREARRRLRRLVRPFVLRRLKEEVLEELPPRTETVLRLDFSPEERRLYESVRLEALRRLEESGETPKARLEVLAVLTRLRQICCSPRLLDPHLALPETKLSALTELVEEIVSGGHRVLVFSQFVSYLRLIEEALFGKGLSYLTLEGSLSAARRRELVERFQRGEVPVFLISLRAGGVGLNLTAADYVVITDPWWNPAVEEQAADRAHRIGQTRPVTVYRLVIRNTVEERVLELHREKKRLGQEILSDTGTPALSLEELRILLSS